MTKTPDAFCLIGCGGSSGSHLLGAMLNNLHTIKAGPELNLFHPHELYHPDTFRATFYAYLTRRGQSLPFEIEGYAPYSLRPKHVVENRNFYGLSTCCEELSLLDQAHAFDGVLAWFREHLIAKHLWAKDFYWLDHTPRNALAALHVLRFFPQSRFIHLVRDGRDAIVSQYHRFKNDRFKRAPAKQCLELAWVLWTYLESHALLASQEPGYLRVYYEDLVTEPFKEINRVLKHLGFSSLSKTQWQAKKPTTPEDFHFHHSAKAPGWLSSPFASVNKDSIGRWQETDLPLAWHDILERPLRFENMPETTLEKLLSFHAYI
jgi:hypothetical protein